MAHESEPVEQTTVNLSRRNVLKKAGGLALGILGTSQILNTVNLGTEDYALGASLQDFQKPLPNLSKPNTRTTPELLNVLKAQPGGTQILQKLEQTRRLNPTFPPLSITFTPTQLQVGTNSLQFLNTHIKSDLGIWLESKHYGNTDGSYAFFQIYFPHPGYYLFNIEGIVNHTGGDLEASIREAGGGLGFYSNPAFQTWKYPNGAPSQKSFPALYSVTEPQKKGVLFRIDKGGNLNFIEASIQAM